MSDDWQLYDAAGRRKYLTAAEQARFLDACLNAPSPEQGLGLLLLFSGCRISEALALRPSHIDREAGNVVLRTLKRRGGVVRYRAVPVPMAIWGGARECVAQGRCCEDRLIWPWSRTTGWRRIKALMARAGIVGPQASPKGLRHGMVITALANGVPLTQVRKWLGHASLRSTAVYTEASGPEERAFAERYWQGVHPGWGA